MNSEIKLPDTSGLKKIKKGKFVYFEDGTAYNEHEVLLIKKIKEKKPKENLIDFIHFMKKEYGMVLTKVE